MRFLVQLLFIMITASVLELILPWWSIAIAAFIGGVGLRTRLNFVAGFLSIALLWTITSITIGVSAGSPLVARVAAIFSLPTPVLYLVTAVIGGLVGGFACMAGASLRREKRRVRYY